ncbi:MAG: hypothetical protein ACLT2Z_09180 [Eubacterium sp.]
MYNVYPARVFMGNTGSLAWWLCCINGIYA